MNSFIRASISFSSLVAGLGLVAYVATIAGTNSVKHPEASAGATVIAAALAQTVPVIDVPEILIRGEASPAPRKLHRSAPTGERVHRAYSHELEQGGRPGAEYVVVRD